MTVLYKTWRPMVFSDVRGQLAPVRVLQNSIITGRIGHGYLLAGQHGSGKTTLGRIFAKAINCTAPTVPGEPCNACASCVSINEGTSVDVQEVDAASNGRIDDIRKLRTDAELLPQIGRYKVYILDECHQITRDGWDALLKTLEEPPPTAVFIMCTTNVNKVPETVQSRAMRLDFRRIAIKDIRESLTVICAAEGIEIEPEALEDIAKSASGSLRDAQSLLDQARCLAPNTLIKASAVRRMLGMASAAFIEELCRVLLSRNKKDGLDLLIQAAEHGLDATQIAIALLDRLRLVHYAQLSVIQLPPQETSLREQSLTLGPAAVRRCLDILSLQWMAQPGYALDTNLELELKFLNCVEALGG